MSLASLLRSRLSSSVAPLISWTTVRSRSISGIYNFNTSIIPSLMSGGSNNISSSRSVWSEVIRQVPSDDPNKAGQLTFEDPDLADSRMLRAVRAEGKLLLYCSGLHNFILWYVLFVFWYLVLYLSSPIIINVYCLQLSTVSSIYHSTITKKTKLCQTWKEMDEVSRS